MEEEQKKNENCNCKNDLFVQLMSAIMLVIFFISDIMHFVTLENKDFYYASLFVTFVTGKTGVTNFIKSIPIKVGK